MKKGRNFLDYPVTKTIYLIGAILAIILAIIQIWGYIHNVPKLEIYPYNNNETISYYIFNNGNKVAHLDSYRICLFDKQSNTCYTYSMSYSFGKPLEIKPQEGKVINTNYSIDFIENSLKKDYDSWGSEFCEKNIGCDAYLFGDAIPKEIPNQGYVMFKIITKINVTNQNP